MILPQTNYSKAVFLFLCSILFVVANIFWINSDSLATRIAVYLYGLHFVFSYSYNKTQHGPAFTFRPDTSPKLRFIVFMIGLLMMFAAITNKHGTP